MIAGGTAASAKAIPKSPVLRFVGVGVTVGEPAAAEAKPKNPRFRRAGFTDNVEVEGLLVVEEVNGVVADDVTGVDIAKQVQALDILLATQAEGIHA